MPIFEYILILFVAIYLSNVVHRFIPVLSVPIIQIALGALITLLPLGFQLEFDPQLFFVLFVAPLIFYVSLTADKKTMWVQRKQILNMGILLVFVTVIVVGYLLNFLIPSIPLAAAFALIAALGPTDDVAVASISKRVNVPPKIMTILQGESIINDASGIVSFQFALAAILTGSFSFVNATGRFFVVALGGIAVGLLLTSFKYILVRWIRSWGMENVTLHLLLGLTTPFVVYLVAEAVGVSGILAIFAAGIAHSFNRDKFNPEKVTLNIASESVWSMLTFTLEGLVFVILGTQLPKILSSISQNTYPITAWEIIIYILLITLVFLLLRFAWSVITIKKKIYDDPKHPISRFRAGIIFSLSGARGAVTLACVMSIPFLLSDGIAFPERDLIILIAGGVIVISLLITSFILPLCVEKNEKKNISAENQVYLEIFQNVIAELKAYATPENETTVAIMVSNYYSRIAELQRKRNSRYHVDYEEERKLRITICDLSKEYVLGMLERGEIDKYAVQYYLNFIDRLKKRLLKKRFTLGQNILHTIYNHYFIRNHRIASNEERMELHNKIIVAIEATTHFILKKLKEMSEKEDSPAIRKITMEYEFSLSMHLHQRGLQQKDVDREMFATIASYAFQAERNNIQAMFEAGRISWETATEMRHNISLFEMQLEKTSF